MPPPCSMCGLTPAQLTRPLVPDALLGDDGFFDFDPLGTAGAQALLCETCAELLHQGMVGAEDLEAFGRVLRLYLSANPTDNVRGERAARFAVFHRAFRLGLLALERELLKPAAHDRPRYAEQLGLFASKSARLAKLAEMLERADWSGARAMAADLSARHSFPEVDWLARKLPVLVALDQEAAGDPDRLGQLCQEAPTLIDRDRIGATLHAALLKGLHRRTAEACETEGRETRAAGHVAGWYWLQAGDRARAKASLADSAVGGPGAPEALVLLGNLAFEDNELAVAREHYRRAFCCDPQAVPVELIRDPAVYELLDEAQELELEPAPEWAPLLGHARGLFRLPPEPDGGPGCRAFHESLLASRSLRKEGRADVDARRAMRSIAPTLFEALRDAGRL